MAVEVDNSDYEDVKVAVVMNGGVSLAIWIGGVTLELNRLASSDPINRTGDYWRSLKVVKSKAAVDVIAGTSAGGMNGAFLALARVYRLDLSLLRTLWEDSGSLSLLLRDPLKADPPSLLKGDEFFLPQLNAALKQLRNQPKARLQPPEDAPIHLIMTTTLIRGERRTFSDTLGNLIEDEDNQGFFVFKRGPDETSDPFEDDIVLDQLALAARSTASFPGAFEASYVPIKQKRPPLHPDMHGRTNFASSGFVLDGGVLMNKPVEPALRAIFRQRADRQVRRVLAYVDPDPGVAPAGDVAPEPPTLFETLEDSLFTIPRAQSIHAELAEIDEHNRKVRERRDGRIDLIVGLQGDVEGLAAASYESYRVARRREVANKLVDLMQDERSEGRLAVPEEGAAPWDVREVFDVLTGADIYLPTVPPPGFLEARKTEVLSQWGTATAERAALIALDLVRRAVRLAPLGDQDRELRVQLQVLGESVHDKLATVRKLRIAEVNGWRDRVGELPGPPIDPTARATTLRTWAESLPVQWSPRGRPTDSGAEYSGREAYDDALRTVITGIAGIIERLAPPARAAAARAADVAGDQILREGGRPPQGLARLAGWVTALVGIPGEQRPASLVNRVLEFEVLFVLLLGPSDDVEQEVALVHVSAQAPNTFGVPAVPSQKLAGVQLGHFGAFYKRSWRVNDWIWGRLDGAMRVIETTLSPRRLLQLRLTPDDAWKLIECAALGGLQYDEDRPYLELLAKKNDCLMELDFLRQGSGGSVPRVLHECSTAVARRHQLEILREELPALVKAVRADMDGGGGKSPAAMGFLRDYDLLASGGLIPPADVFNLFARAAIGSERIVDEAGTDLFASTVSKTAAVGVGAVDSKHSGLGAVRAITRTLRGFTLTLYALVYGSVVGSRFAAAMVNFALAAGGALVAVSLLADDPPVLVGTIGTLLVVAGLGLAALRARTWQLFVVVLLPPLVILAILLGTKSASEVVAHAGTLLVVGGLVATMMLVGSLGRLPPFTRVSLLPGAAVLLLSLGATIAIALWLKDVGTAGVRIIPFELSWTNHNAWGHLRSVDVPALATLRNQVYLDFLFLALYWVPVAILCSACARAVPPEGPRWISRVGGFFSWGALEAALLDAGENFGLLEMIDARRAAGSLSEFAEAVPAWIPAATSTLAVSKFALLIAAAGYIVVAGFVLGWNSLADRR